MKKVYMVPTGQDELFFESRESAIQYIEKNGEGFETPISCVMIDTAKRQEITFHLSDRGVTTAVTHGQETARRIMSGILRHELKGLAYKEIAEVINNNNNIPYPRPTINRLDDMLSWEYTTVSGRRISYDSINHRMVIEFGKSENFAEQVLAYAANFGGGPVFD